MITVVDQTILLMMELSGHVDHGDIAFGMDGAKIKLVSL